MSLTHWLRNLQTAWHGRRTGGGESRHRQPVSRWRPVIEVLEDRFLPSTLTVLNNGDSGAGSLRAELAAAAPGDTIAFDPGLAGQTITLTGGPITLTNGVTIAGPGAGLVSISGGGASRVVAVPNGVAATLSGLTIRDGLAPTPDRFGGGILNHGSLTLLNCEIRDNQANNGGRGGGIFSDGLLFAVNCFIHNNKAAAFASAAGGGAGIFTNGTAGLTGCTISDNTGVGDTNANPNEGNTFGGGIFNDTNGVLTLSNCTLANNVVQNGKGNAFGAALQNNGFANIRNSTIAINHSESDGGGIHAIFASTLQLFDTLVAANSATFGPDIDGVVTSLGHNLIGNPANTTGLIASDLQNFAAVNIQLLGDNGGPVPTVGLRSDSPAVNAGDPASAPATEQRGFNRVVDGAIDIGAFEFQPPDVTVALTSSANPSAATVPVTFTATVAGVAAGANVPGGGVLFLIDNVPQAAAAVKNGAATFTTSSLSVGTHQIQAQYAGDFNFDGASATLAPAQQITAPPPGTQVNATALDANHAFVQHLYQDILGRDGSPQELDGWVGVLLQNGSAVVVTGVERSFEGRTHLVEGFYQNLLGRTAQNGEEQVFVQELFAGATEEQVQANILGSTEFFNHAPQVPGVGGGAPSDQKFVQALFQLLLHRSANSAEVTGFVSQIPLVGRGGVAAVVLVSNEFREQQVRSFFSLLLQRPNPAQSEVDGWVHSGLDLGSIRIGVESSLEFFQHG